MTDLENTVLDLLARDFRGPTEATLFFDVHDIDVADARRALESLTRRGLVSKTVETRFGRRGRTFRVAVYEAL